MATDGARPSRILVGGGPLLPDHDKDAAFPAGEGGLDEIRGSAAENRCGSGRTAKFWAHPRPLEQRAPAPTDGKRKAEFEQCARRGDGARHHDVEALSQLRIVSRIFRPPADATAVYTKLADGEVQESGLARLSLQQRYRQVWASDGQWDPRQSRAAADIDDQAPCGEIRTQAEQRVGEMQSGRLSGISDGSQARAHAPSVEESKVAQTEVEDSGPDVNADGSEFCGQNLAQHLTRHCALCRMPPEV